MPKRKPTSGQISLIGEYYMLGVKYPPKVSRTASGLAVAVVRVPKDADPIDRAKSMEALHQLAKETKSIIPNYRRRGMKR